jgi:hypothetical protein
MGYTMRTDRYRFVEWLPRGANPSTAPDGTVELYDHKNDPQENINLASRPEYKEQINKLRRQLRRGWKAARPPDLSKKTGR